MNPLTSPAHLFGALLSDPQVEALWSSERFLAEFGDFEAALAEALADAGVVPPDVARCAVADIAAFRPDAARIAAATALDGVPVPEYLRGLKAHAGPDAEPAIHTGATSQDVIDTAVSRILKDVNALLQARLSDLLVGLDGLADAFGENRMMGRTRMQAALEIRVADRIDTWRLPLRRLLAQFPRVRSDVEVLQFGGAVGDGAALGRSAEPVAAALARRLALARPERAWHPMRASLAGYAGWLSLVTGALGKAGQDICLMAQQGVGEISLAGSGTSSAMPHKRNPVKAELLVALARHNATLLAGMHQAMVHEQERSGAAWALEWLTLPEMTVTTGRALDLAIELTGEVRSVGHPSE